MPSGSADNTQLNIVVYYMVNATVLPALCFCMPSTLKHMPMLTTGLPSFFEALRKKVKFVLFRREIKHESHTSIHYFRIKKLSPQIYLTVSKSENHDVTILITLCRSRCENSEARLLKNDHVSTGTVIDLVNA